MTLLNPTSPLRSSFRISTLAGLAPRALAATAGLTFLWILLAAWLSVARSTSTGLDTLPPLAEGDWRTVSRVWRGSPAEHAGLRAGDQILAVQTHHVLDESVQASVVAGGREALLVRRIGLRSLERPREVVLSLRSPLGFPQVRTDLIALSALGTLFLAVGIVVIIKRPDETAARLLFFGGSSLAISQAAAITGYGSQIDWTGTLEPWFFRLAVGAALHLFLAFPAPRPLLRWLRGSRRAILYPIGGATLALYLIPLGLGLLVRLGPVWLSTWWPLFLAFWLGLGLLALVDNYHRLENERLRAQTRVILWSLVVAVLGFTLWLPVPILPRAVMLLMAAMFPISIAFAILRYRLFEIDLIIRRTLIYGVLTASLALTYFGSVALIQRFTPARSQADIVISTLAIAALFQPLRRRIQGTIDHRFYRRRYDAEWILTQFAASLRDEVDPAQVVGGLLSAVAETVQPSHASIWLNETVGKVGSG